MDSWNCFYVVNRMPSYITSRPSVPPDFPDHSRSISSPGPGMPQGHRTGPGLTGQGGPAAATTPPGPPRPRLRLPADPVIVAPAPGKTGQAYPGNEPGGITPQNDRLRRMGPGRGRRQGQEQGGNHPSQANPQCWRFPRFFTRPAPGRMQRQCGHGKACPGSRC